jgi:hypothetical protein
MGALASQVERLRTATDDLLAFTPEIAAREPWPLAELYGPEPEASWGPPELLAHVEEFLPYWMGEIERVLAAPADAPAAFGRIATDPLRIGVIGRDRSLPVRELVARIQAEGRRVADRLDELTEAEAARTGSHPARGVLTVRAMLEPFLVGHMEGHVVQLREILAAAG